MDAATADFNEDGRADFIGNSNHTYTYLFLGGASGPTHAQTLSLGHYGRGMDAADFNDDGHYDFVRARNASGYLDLHLGRGDATFEAARRIGDVGTDPYAVTAGDFDEDGNVDVIANYGSSGNISFYRGNGDGTFQAKANIAALDQNNHGAFDAYDFDGDGHLDIAAVNYTGRRIRWARGNGDGTFGGFVNLGTLPRNSLGIATPFHQRGPNRPTAVIAASNVFTPVADAVTFDGTASVNFATSTWDFGDGSDPIVGAAPGVVEHTFARAGVHFVRLTVTTDAGRVHSAVVRVTAQGSGPAFRVATCDPANPPACEQEVCNGLDDDCDGVIDDDPIDANGECTATLGVCSVTGPTACVDGQVVCTAEPPVASPERCNGLDDDCDGAVDEVFANLGGGCVSGAGECAVAGTTICNGGQDGTLCDAVANAPGAEICDGLDNNCDGLVDDGFALNQACTSGVGACLVAGRTTCDAGGDGVRCDAVAGAPVPELCDQIDNDCDGDVDEDFPVLECGVGACYHTIGQCDANPPACDPLRGAGFEICNGIDDDCDGEIDEQPSDAGLPCTEGLGLCAAEGTSVCVMGTLLCDGVPGAPAVEVCDQQDNDCDGATDEGEICPDVTGPTIALTVEPLRVDPGQLMALTAVANDDRAVARLNVTMAGQNIALGLDGGAFFNAPNAPGVYEVRAEAEDSSANVTVATERVIVEDINDVILPEVAITVIHRQK